ncbi:MAG TPA: hypothetical protein VK830_05085, partial [Xanthomonadales bacterium]|nr:hypothetical protein [Xanthomonadales bacterium]
MLRRARTSHYIATGFRGQAETLTMVYSLPCVPDANNGSLAMLMLELFGDWEDQVEFPKGAVIFRETDEADYMYVVLKG